MSLFSGMKTVDLTPDCTATIQDNHDACKVADGLVVRGDHYSPYAELGGPAGYDAARRPAG
jgi:hypothetical protein